MPVYPIIIPMTAKYRARITKAILDWAESLPKTQSGYIHSLQKERGRQRVHAQEAFEKSRPPQGTEIEILAIRMFDIFQFEEFGKLKANIKKMFPDLGGFQWGKTFDESFEKLSESLYPGWKMNIGLIYKDKEYLIPNKFHLSSLPDDVDYISIGLHKMLPSMIFITFDVYLNASASSTLKKIQSQKHLPELEIEFLFPSEKYFGTSEWSAERSREQAVIGWLDNIRKNIETSISTYFNGYFMQQSTNTARLPAIEIYGLKRNPKTKKSFVSWVKSTRNWCDSLGFQFYSNTFNNSSFAFSWAHKAIFSDTKIAHRVLVFWRLFQENANTEMNSGDEKFGVLQKINFFLDNILTLFVAVEFLGKKVENIKKYRTDVFVNMTHGKTGIPNLNKQLRLYANLQEERRSTERFLLEFDQVEEFTQRRIEESELEKLAYTNLMGHNNFPIKNFKESITGETSYLRKTFDEHMSFLNKFFSEYIQLLNTDAVYRLQRVGIALSFIALIIACVGLLGSWESIVKLIKLIICTIRLQLWK